MLAIGSELQDPAVACGTRSEQDSGVRLITSMPLSSVGRTYEVERSVVRPIWIYFNARNNHANLKQSLPQGFNLINLSHTQPWADGFVDASKTPESFVQRQYRAHTNPRSCVVRSGLSICADIFSAYKVAAVYDALSRFPCDDVLWLDTDAYVAQKIDPILAWMRRFDVVTISRNFTPTANPETGVVFFNGRRDATREVLSRARAMFEAPKTHWRPGNPVTAGISDVHVYRRLLIDKPPRSARMGWFAAKPCGNTTKTVLERMRGYQVDVRDLHCPGARDDVSPFHLFEYIVHSKHGRGLLHKRKHGASQGTIFRSST